VKPSNWRADLADLGNDQLFVAVALVRAERTGAALGVHVVLAARIERHVASQHVRELEGLAGLDQLRGAQDVGGLHVIAGAAFVGGAPFRRAALAR